MHELTKRINDTLSIYVSKIDDSVVTSYMQEKAEWLKKQHPGGTGGLWCSNLDINQAFGLTKKTLAEKMTAYWKVEHSPTIDNMCEMAREHFRENPEDLR